MAQAALKSGMITEAVARAKQATDMDPSADNFLTLGLAYLAMPGDTDLALESFQSAIDAGGGTAHTWALLSHARFDEAYGASTGVYTAAQEAAEEALALDPDEPLAHAVLAEIAAAAAAREQALAEVELALENGARDDVTLSNIGWVYGLLDDWPHAVEYRQLVVELAPKRGDYRLSLANAHRMNNQLEEAKQEARTALTLDSSWASQAHAQLGLIYQEEGDSAAAEEELKAALRADPTSEFALWALGKILYDQERYAEALPYFQRAVDEDPNDGGNLTWLGACLIELERYDEAREALEQAVKIDPTRDDAQRMLDDLPSE